MNTISKVIDTVTLILKDGSYINIAINNVLKSGCINENEQSLFTRIVYGTVENKILLDYYLQPYIQGKRVKPHLKNALRVGLYMLDYTSLATHYVVNEVVEATKEQDYNGSKFINSILRKLTIDERRSLSSLDKLSKLSIEYSIPKEIIDYLYLQYQEQIIDILKPHQDNINVYRVNQLKITCEELENLLKEITNETYYLEKGCLKTTTNLLHSDLFKKGYITFQDESSQMVGFITNPQVNDTILDVCASPGGKSAHLAEIMHNTGKIIACDIYEHKLKLMEETFKRLGVNNVLLLLADATIYDYTLQLKNGLADIVLCDVPCSGLGVLNHKADLKYRISLKQIDEIIDLQFKILEHSSRFVKNNGVLVYSTCTINKYENDYQIARFIKTHPDFIIESQQQILPNDHQDGFYICRMIKRY